MTVKRGDLVRIKIYSGSFPDDTAIRPHWGLGLVISELMPFPQGIDRETGNQLALVTVPWVEVYLLKSERVVEAYPGGNLEIISTS
jgi:hypothetical protein